ncbi:MAG TPA: hypothetical protein VFC00_22855 [Micromonosporaceae bacterium]|nr:hypothetical protein [Micromonosporaceae bacterium]
MGADDYGQSVQEVMASIQVAGGVDALVFGDGARAAVACRNPDKAEFPLVAACRGCSATTAEGAALLQDDRLLYDQHRPFVLVKGLFPCSATPAGGTPNMGTVVTIIGD